MKSTRRGAEINRWLDRQEALGGAPWILVVLPSQKSFCLILDRGKKPRCARRLMPLETKNERKSPA